MYGTQALVQFNTLIQPWLSGWKLSKTKFGKNISYYWNWDIFDRSKNWFLSFTIVYKIFNRPNIFSNNFCLIYTVICADVIALPESLKSRKRSSILFTILKMKTRYFLYSFDRILDIYENTRGYIHNKNTNHEFSSVIGPDSSEFWRLYQQYFFYHEQKPQKNEFWLLLTLM